MYFDSWSAFWDMGGYGFFVWLAFGVTWVSMLLMIAETIYAKKGLLKQVEQQYRRQQRISASKVANSKAQAKNQAVDSE